MSCKKCNISQKINGLLPIFDVIAITYVKVGNGDVAIIGCDKHLKMLLEQLNNKDKWLEERGRMAKLLFEKGVRLW